MGRVMPCARFTTSARKDPVELSEAIRKLMRSSAQPVALVSSFLPNAQGTGLTRKIHATTLSSFTTVSLAPPLVAFSIRLPSRMADALHAGASIPSASAPNTAHTPLMERKPHFLIHILSSEQGPLSDFFARPGAPSFEVGAQNDETHPFHRCALQPSTSIEGQLIPRDALGSLACSLVYQLDLSSADLHGTTAFENGCMHTNEVGSTLFLAHIHDVETGMDERGVPATERCDPLIYWLQRYSTLHRSTPS